MSRTISTQQRTSTQVQRSYEMTLTGVGTGNVGIYVRREAVFVVDGVQAERRELPSLVVDVASLPSGIQNQLNGLIAAIEAQADTKEAGAL